MDFIGLECINGTVVHNDVHTSGTIITLVALGLINIAVVLGNSLVIAAVITTRKLRTVTNIFIVSLASADLLLGFAVLPFSISVEVLDIWIWGRIWCNIWLAVDVWLCTASIISLCAISLDRYIAVTHPIRYPSIMSPIRGKVLVSSVWILSFVICLPPLLGWNDQSHILSEQTEDIKNSSVTNASNVVTDLSTPIPMGFISDDYNVSFDELFNDGFLSNLSVFFLNSTEPCNLDLPVCELTSTRGYRIYAAMGSFYIPMLVMVFFYFRIYMTAVKTADSLRKGVLTTKTSNDLSQSNGHTEEHIHLRVHRGGSTQNKFPNTPTEKRKFQSSHIGANDSPMIEKRDLSTTEYVMRDKNKNDTTTVTTGCNSHSIVFIRPFGSRWRRKCLAKPIKLVQSNNCDKTFDKGSKAKPDLKSTSVTSKSQLLNVTKYVPDSTRSPTSPKRFRLFVRDPKTLSSKGHARKFRREAKAAKTLAIIVGAFIVCWLPFFTIYLIGAFCEECVSSLVFSVFFWLGYCNSALNPCIYALFARDFRSAFQRLVSCRRRGFDHASRADYITGSKKHQSAAIQLESDSISDY